MELDPSQEQMNGPLTPASPGMDTSDELRMSVDEEDNKVKFSLAAAGLKELAARESETDHLEHGKVISADDRIYLRFVTELIRSRCSNEIFCS
jgi:hypothetical protein